MLLGNILEKIPAFSYGTLLITGEYTIFPNFSKTPPQNALFPELLRKIRENQKFSIYLWEFLNDLGDVHVIIDIEWSMQLAGAVSAFHCCKLCSYLTNVTTIHSTPPDGVLSNVFSLIGISFVCLGVEAANCFTRKTRSSSCSNLRLLQSAEYTNALCVFDDVPLLLLSFHILVYLNH